LRAVKSAKHTAINTDPGAFVSVYFFHKIVREVMGADTEVKVCGPTK
jgi:hypothetical protein